MDDVKCGKMKKNREREREKKEKKTRQPANISTCTTRQGIEKECFCIRRRKKNIKKLSNQNQIKLKITARP
jgi:hypothetical protein